MGLSKVRIHIKASNENIQREIEQYIRELPSEILGAGLEDIPEEIREMMSIPGFDADMEEAESFIFKNGILSTDKIGFENFEETGQEISQTYQTPVMAAFVFDSDIAAIQVYQNGQTVLEEFYPLSEEYGKKKSMDKKSFIQLFDLSCNAEELEEIFSMENVVFAEEILQKAGEIIGIDLI